MTFLFFLSWPSEGDQAETCLGQDSPDDDHSGPHGPSLTPDALFPSDYQDEGECRSSGFGAVILCDFSSFRPGVLAHHHLTQAAFSRVSVLVITSLPRTTICCISLLALLGNSVPLLKLMCLGKH